MSNKFKEQDIERVKSFLSENYKKDDFSDSASFLRDIVIVCSFSNILGVDKIEKVKFGKYDIGDAVSTIRKTLKFFSQKPSKESYQVFADGLQVKETEEVRHFAVFISYLKMQDFAFIDNINLLVDKSAEMLNELSEHCEKIEGLSHKITRFKPWKFFAYVVLGVIFTLNLLFFSLSFAFGGLSVIANPEQISTFRICMLAGFFVCVGLMALLRYITIKDFIICYILWCATIFAWF